MGMIHCTRDTTVDRAVGLRWEWVGDTRVDIDLQVIAMTDQWHGPRPPLRGDVGQFGPYRLQCLGYDPLRGLYTFERLP